MKTIIALIAIAELSGCVLSPTGFINKHVPNGTISSIHLAVGVTGGSGGTIDAKGVTKTDTALTAEEFHMTMHDLLNPFFQIDVVAPPSQPVTMTIK